MPKPKFFILTNNPLVESRLGGEHDVRYYSVSYEQLFVMARDLLHQGHALLSHPLSGSIKPQETPYKSIMLSQAAGPMDMDGIVLMESCIDTCKKFQNKREGLTQRVLEDFQLVDLTLIESAIPSAIQL